MRLCLNCHRLWPGDSVFCGQCGRSFGGRLCAKQHLSPPSAQVCVHCGRTELTEPAMAFPVGGLLRTLCWCGVLLAAWWLWSRYGCCLLREMQQAAAWLVAAGLLLALLPDPLGGRLRRGVKGLLRAIAAFARFVYGLRAGGRR